MEPLPPVRSNVSARVRPAQPIEELEQVDARSRRPIGGIFVELGLISDDQLQSALDAQRETGARLGEILVEQGSLSRLDLAGALAAHWEPQVVAPAGPTPAGNESRAPADAEELDALRREVSAFGLRLEAVEARPVPVALPVQRRGRMRRAENAEVVELTPRVVDLEARLTELAPTRVQLRDLGESVEALVDLRTSDALALGARLAHLEATSEAVSSAGDRLADELRRSGERISEIARANIGLTHRVDEVADTAAARAADVAVLTADLAVRLDDLVRHLGSVEGQATATHRETTSIAARADEILALHHSDGRAARAELDEIASQVETLVALAALVDRLESRLEGQAMLAEIRALALESALGDEHKKHKKNTKRGKKKKERKAEKDAENLGGWLAFAPTPEGFRLLELGGSAPEIGATVELPELDGPLVVTRVGRSPLPFDSRACAFLDRA